jgi:hypothetical protein
MRSGMLSSIAAEAAEAMAAEAETAAVGLR